MIKKKCRKSDTVTDFQLQVTLDSKNKCVHIFKNIKGEDLVMAAEEH